MLVPWMSLHLFVLYENWEEFGTGELQGLVHVWCIFAVIGGGQ